MKSTSLTGTITREDKEGGWTFVTWPDSTAFLGMGKAVKVAINIGGHEFNVTSLPTGDGTHFLPLNKAIMKKIGKQVGDSVTIEISKLPS